MKQGIKAQKAISQEKTGLVKKYERNMALC
jgi:hypothetical protein